MTAAGPADRINLLDFTSPSMRAFHMAWLAFFLCFFSWFGLFPLMPIIREELHLTKEQIGWCMIGAGAITIIARLIIGGICDKYGPRKAYATLLVVSSLPVMAIGFAHDFTSFLILRMLIGVIGAAFVITQYHTSVMFSPKCVGTANATTAGWGNFGGGATQIIMPLLLAGLMSLGFSQAVGWRLCMVIAGVLCWGMAFAYYKLTQDRPDGFVAVAQGPKVSFATVCQDRRVWGLALAYAACFGTELTMKSIAVLYYVDYFDAFKSMDTLTATKYAGMLAALFGATNIFARTLGGLFSDRCGAEGNLAGRVRWLCVTLLGCGMALMLFSQMRGLYAAVPAMLLLSTLTQMSCGATFGVVPFMNRKGLGAVAGIVGAGGNLGYMAAGFLFKAENLSWPTAILILGSVVTSSAFVCYALISWTPAETPEAQPATA